MPPFFGVCFFTELFKIKNTNPEADPKTGQFVDSKTGRFLEKIARVDAIFLRGLPLAFCSGCFILTCLLGETGAGLALVARQ